MQTERQKVLGEATSPGSTGGILGSPKASDSGSPLEIQKLNPYLPGDLGLTGLLCNFLYLKASLHRVPEAGDQ